MLRAKTLRALLAAVCALSLCAATASAELAGHWKLDETFGTTAADSSEHGNNGQLRGGPLWWPLGGAVNGALEFDGKDDYVVTRLVLDPGEGSFSAFAWVRGESPSRAILSQSSGSGYGTTWLGTDETGRLLTALTDGGRFTGILTSEASIADNVWRCVGVVWDGSRRRLYIDGEQAAEDAAAIGPLRAANGGLYFGAERTLSEGAFWAGLLDDVRVYNHALDAAAIKELAAQGGNQNTDDVSVLILAPKTIYAQTAAALSVTVRDAAGTSAADVPVTLRFVKSASERVTVFEGATGQTGRVNAQFDTPDVAPGAYTLEIGVEGMAGPLEAPVQLRELPVLLIETDKPIYKPGQTMHGRVLVLTNELKPSPDSPADVEITDGKGVKIFRKALTTNAFGVAPFELPLATELNFGTWKIAVESASASGSLDVRVEKYVLPRFEVELLTGHDYVLVDQQVVGTVNAAYFFGKPVDGTAEIRASRYIGVWDEYATYSGTLADGSLEFTLPPVEYVSGTPATGGAGSLQLELTVTDTSGHEEKTTKLLTVVESEVQHRVISLSRAITPGQGFEVLLVTETPDGEPFDFSAKVTATYLDSYQNEISQEVVSVSDAHGAATVSLTAPKDTASASIKSEAQANGETAEAKVTIFAAYSPTDSFLQLSRDSDDPVKVGETVTIDTYKTHNVTVYYDVYANGHTVWSDATTGSQIVIQATQQMVPSAKVVAYIINPNNEISADTLELDVILEDAAGLDVQFSAEQVLPGDPVQVSVQADTQAMVGLAIVDESVYALNKNRLNMQKVFEELERIFMEPKQETHGYYTTYGASEILGQAGLQVIVSGSLNAPSGRPVWDWGWWRGGPALPWAEDAMGGGGGGQFPGPPPSPEPGNGTDLAEVTRIRQFFPETWLWLPDLLTETDGTAQIDLNAPDSITTWRLHALSTSDNGVGIAESALLVFQEFFGEPDLPYAVTRGEQFPVRVQIFNYLDVEQLVRVELAEADWFDLLEEPVQEITVKANSVSLASFLIQPKKLGRNMLEVTLRSPLRADAVRKELLVEPEGTRRERIENGMIRAGEKITLDANMPSYIVEGSGKLLLSITPSLVAQTINGMDDLLNMPYGCGEQNMMFFSTDVEILRYLDATGQLAPEIRAKAEHFITCGYQRQLTYRRADGSFSAFGDSDQSGSLWLTAFVLNSFSGAQDVHTIDETVLAEAASWIVDHQKDDGSWEPVGFIHHKEMIGGMSGNFALTGFVTIALAEYGSAAQQALDKALQYLEDNVSSAQDDAYALAIAALAFARVGNDTAADAAIARLLEIAISDGDGIHWKPYPIETTAYAALAMIARENAQANGAIKWLSLQQNSKGGFGSTQDTVMALKALMTAARTQSRNVNLTVVAKSADGTKLAEISVDPNNFDVLQIAELPQTDTVELGAKGIGEVRFQLVRRFNVFIADETICRDMSLEVTYDANNVEVDDIVNVTAIVRYFGLMGSTGMMIVDVGVPTGFAVVQETLDALVDAGKVSKVEVAGRKVIFYVDEMAPGEARTLNFQVKARFPVRAIIPDSKAYLYYDPDVRAEAAGRNIAVGMMPICSVDFKYLIDFAGQWLQAGPGLTGDLNLDGEVNFEDYQILANNWGGLCP